MACEGVPALFVFMVGGSSHHGSCIRLKGNALDVAMIRNSANLSIMAVSIDHIHVSGSTTEARSGYVRFFTRRVGKTDLLIY